MQTEKARAYLITRQLIAEDGDDVARFSKQRSMR